MYSIVRSHKSTEKGVRERTRRTLKMKCDNYFILFFLSKLLFLKQKLIHTSNTKTAPNIIQNIYMKNLNVYYEKQYWWFFFFGGSFILFASNTSPLSWHDDSMLMVCTFIFTRVMEWCHIKNTTSRSSIYYLYILHAIVSTSICNHHSEKVLFVYHWVPIIIA